MKVKKLGGKCAAASDLGYGGTDIGVTGCNGLKEKYAASVTVKNACLTPCNYGTDVCPMCLGDMPTLSHDCAETVYKYGVDSPTLTYVDGPINLKVVGVLAPVSLNCGVSSVTVKHSLECENCVDEAVGKKVIDKDYSP